MLSCRSSCVEGATRRRLRSAEGLVILAVLGVIGGGVALSKLGGGGCVDRAELGGGVDLAELGR